MSMPASQLALTAALSSLTWPVCLAHASLRLIFMRPYIADEVGAWALPLTAVFALVVGLLSSRFPPKEPTEWVVRCALCGAIVAPLWFACGGYIDAKRSAQAFVTTLLGGGLVYGAPAGLVAGTALGLEIVGLERWSGRRSDGSVPWRSIAVTLFANAMLAVGIWLALES